MSNTINKRVYYLHIPKTGGNWVRSVLRNSNVDLNKTNKFNKHANYDFLAGLSSKSLMSSSFNEDIKFFCVIRHPLLWYQSWYKYQNDNGWKFWGEKGILQKEKWHCLSPLNMSRPKSFNDFMRIVNQTSPGFLTYLYHSFILPSGARILKNENLRDDLLHLNKDWSLGLNERFILHSKKVNVSTKTEISWSEENLTNTMQNESAIIKMYGYKEEPISIINLSNTENKIV